MLNIVIPMAGHGRRFSKAGYQTPKPLIKVCGQPMIGLVTENIRPKREHRFIYLCLQEHIEKYDLIRELRAISPGCIVVPVDHVTEGAACTVLLAEEYIDSEDPMMIANSDQYVDYPIDAYLEGAEDADGLVMTMTAQGMNWSYILYNGEGAITLIREKEQISEEATVGIYNFAHGKDFVTYAKQMIEKDLRVKGEFYVAPVYNMLIEDGKTIRYKNTGCSGEQILSLGTPEELEHFLQSPVAKRICERENV